jgi:predicted dehydrogenase
MKRNYGANDQIRIAIIGCGGIGRHHYRQFDSTAAGSAKSSPRAMCTKNT